MAHICDSRVKDLADILVMAIKTSDSGDRKRDLSQGLNTVAADIVHRLFTILFASVDGLPNLPAVRRCKIMLTALMPLIETANLQFFLQASRVNILFRLLNNSELQIEAADCLLQLCQTKPHREDKYEIVRACLEHENFQHLLQLVKNIDEDDSHLLKQLCDILASIGLDAAFGKVKLELFFSAVEALVLRKDTASVLGGTVAINNFLKNLDKMEYENFRKTTFADHLVKIINCIIRKFVTVSLDDREDMSKLKSEILNTLRNSNSIIPNLYLLLNHWISEAHSSNIKDHHWEYLNSMFDSLTSLVKQDQIEVISSGLKDLELCFKMYSLERNLTRKSILLSGVSALFVFLSLAHKMDAFGEHVNNMMCSILKSLFQCFHYAEPEHELRKHVAALFIKLASKNAPMMVTIFDSIYQEATEMKETLKSSEFKSIIEALLIISNEFVDKSNQLSFIGAVINATEWQEMAALTSSEQNLFVSLSSEEVFQAKRPLFSRNFSILSAILRRIKYPKDSPEFTDIVFNHLRGTLPIVLEMIKSIHSLVSIPSLSYTLELAPYDKVTMLGVDSRTNPEVTDFGSLTIEPHKSLQEQFRNFVRALQELAYGILGHCCLIFNRNIYNIPNITEAFLNYVGCCSQYLSDFTIRHFLRTVYKQFLLCCPADNIDTVVKPFMQQFGPFMMNRLMTRWERIISQINEERESPNEEAEILESVCLRNLTKEYFQILVPLLERSKSTDVNLQIEDVEMDEGPVHQNGAPSKSSMAEPGDIGLLLINDQICFESVAYLSINALVWKDSTINLKVIRCITLCWSIIAQQQNVIMGVLRMSLSAVIVFKDQDANFDIILKLIDSILIQHSDLCSAIAQMFVEWGASSTDLNKLVNFRQVDVKKRKDILKKIIRSHPLINQQPKSQWLSNLPKLIINDPSKIQKEQEAAKEIDLRECFSPIHAR